MTWSPTITDILSTFTGVTLFIYLWYSTTFILLPSFFSTTIIVIAHIFSFLTIYSYVIALTTDAGTVNQNFCNQNQENPYCKRCQKPKPPRAHHCRNGCNKCLLKMDHHCPWLGRCVGLRNMGHFVRFVFYAFISCFFGATLLVQQFVVTNITGGGGSGSSNIIYFSTSIILLFNMITFITLSLLLLILLIVTLKNVFMGMTSIERLLFSKKKLRKNPYDLGTMANLSSVLGSRPWTWPISLPFSDWQLGPFADGYSFCSLIGNNNTDDGSISEVSEASEESDIDAESIVIPKDPSYRRRESILFTNNGTSSNTGNSKIL